MIWKMLNQPAWIKIQTKAAKKFCDENLQTKLLWSLLLPIVIMKHVVKELGLFAVAMLNGSQEGWSGNDTFGNRDGIV